MSKERSFGYMSSNELAVKSAEDQYKLQILQDGVVGSFQRHKWTGFDEAAYALAHKLIPGATGRKREYLRNQLFLNEQETRRREEAKPEGFYEALTTRGRTPIYLDRLTTARKGLRRERLYEMHRQGVPLTWDEEPAYVRSAVSHGFDNITGKLGAVGAMISDHLLALTTAAFMAMTATTGYNWYRQAEVYKPVAAAYIQSHEVGPTALPLKRDISDIAVGVYVNLTHTDAMLIKTKNGAVVIPEKLSDPVTARLSIVRMHSTLAELLGDEQVDGFVTVVAEDKTDLKAARNAAASRLETAASSLSFSMNPHISYPLEMGLTVAAVGKIDEAVDILEAYMDPTVVKEENEAHRSMAIWKWLTIIFGGMAGVSFFNGVRDGFRSYRTRSYYGYDYDYD